MSAMSDRLDALNGSDIQIEISGLHVAGKMGTDIEYTGDGDGKEVLTWTSSAGHPHFFPVDKLNMIKCL